jgi:hypothetical protein
LIYCEIRNGEVVYEHYQPFDEKHGLGKTKEELELTGIFVDSLPVNENPLGKTSTLKVDSKTGELYYEYTERELTLEEENTNLIAALKARQDETENAILVLMDMQMGGF